MAGTPEPDLRPPVLLLRPLPDTFKRPLSNSYRFLKPWESPSPSDFLAAHADSIRVILCSGPTIVDADTISKLPRLECVVATSVGVDLIDLPECRRRGIAVTNAGKLYSEDAADYAMGMIVDLLRRVSAADRYARKGLWAKAGDFPLGSKLSGKKVGIIGLGSIGSKIAKRLEAFNCIVAYNSRRQKPSVSYAYFSDVCELASWSDVLVLSCALNNETKHIVNKDVLGALGKKGIVINVGRGRLINEKDLVASLKDGVIGGAGLDVFDNEPMVPPELFDMDNVVLSPHSSVTTPESFANMLQLVTTNLEAFFSNKPLLSLVSE